MNTNHHSTRKPPANTLTQDWTDLEKGDRIHVKLAAGESYFTVVDDLTDARDVVWVAAYGMHRRMMLHCSGPDLVWAAH